MTRPDPLVILPGMMCDERLFAPQVAVIANDRDVIIPKLYGAETITDLARLFLAKVKVPSLILYGAEDQLCPEDRHLAMHDLIAGSKLVKIDGAGHLPCLEKPDETTAALQRWLEEE